MGLQQQKRRENGDGVEWGGGNGDEENERKYVERIGKIFGDRFMGDKQGEREKVDLPGFQCKLGE